MGTFGPFLGVKHKAEPLIATSAEIKNEWKYDDKWVSYDDKWVSYDDK